MLFPRQGVDRDISIHFLGKTVPVCVAWIKYSQSLLCLIFRILTNSDRIFKQFFNSVKASHGQEMGRGGSVYCGILTNSLRILTNSKLP